MLPLLLMVLFGIIDLGYYVYGYATIYQAARNGSEKAAEIPPYQGWLSPYPDRNDPCVAAIYGEIEKGAVLFQDITVQPHVRISYPSGRQVGKSIEIAIVYPIEPLTPLWKFVSFGSQGRMTVSVTSRRTIESLGVDPNQADGNACHDKP